jgi:tRNA nucleotidyltransferase (CCA-adding enzyme)
MVPALICALCRRYALKPYRYPRSRRTTVRVRVPKTFIDDVLWPHYLAIEKELSKYLKEATEKIIAEEVHRDTTEAQEIVQLLGEMPEDSAKTAS